MQALPFIDSADSLEALNFHLPVGSASDRCVHGSHRMNSAFLRKAAECPHLIAVAHNGRHGSSRDNWKAASLDDRVCKYAVAMRATL